jgi:hypothetical protein
MFRDAKGEGLKSVPVEAISRFHPKGVSQARTLEALNFARKAADKRVAHLTFGGSEKEGELELYQIEVIVIHTATGYYLYERLGLPRPERIGTDIRRSSQSV